ncbi:hypothetical protein [Vulcanibacillus modesticaldus]|nr:hypothetical protein [Vulcanibacillus modesticaldus]
MGAFLLGNVAQESQFYNYWITYGTILLGFVAVGAGVSWIIQIKSAAKFIIHSLLTSLTILLIPFVISFFLPDAYVEQVSNNVVIDIEHYDVSIIFGFGSLITMGISLIITLIGSFNLLFKRK